MLRFLFSSWRSKEKDDLEAAATSASSWSTHTESQTQNPKLKLNTSIIGPPIPYRTPNSITGFDVDNDTQWPAPPSPVSSTRSGPSSIAWLRTPTEDQPRTSPTVYPPPPAVIRIGRVDQHAHPVTRSVSSPAPYSSSSSLPTNFNGTTPRWNGKTLMNQAYSGSTHSLRLEHVPYPMNPYTNTYSYPLMKPLSPIAEQDYFSPESFRRTIPLPPGSETSASIATTGASPTPPASTPASEASRPSPVRSNLFISRTVNRSMSQASHKSSISTTSSVAAPPVLPPLDLRPPFPGPHPSAEGGGPQLRPKKSVTVMPTITAGSSEEYDEGGDSESYITATETPHTQSPSYSRVSGSGSRSRSGSGSGSGSGSVTPRARHSVGAGTSTTIPPIAIATTSTPNRIEYTNTEISMIRSEATVSPGAAPSPSESFIRRRWDRDAPYGNGIVTFRVKRQKWWANATPAFWAFWWGFLCPVLWLIGGWHFTNFGEQPPRLTFWEFYFNMGYWKEKLFGVRRKDAKFVGKDEASVLGAEKGKAKAPQNNSVPRLTRWVSEKQSSDFRRARLNDPKRSLRGIISFGYPFVPRPAPISDHDDTIFGRLAKLTKKTLAKPNRCFDQIYGVKLTDVQGKREGARRMFDPWIQRCRYAFCYGMLLLCAGLGTATALLLIVNTRDLHNS
ncbi:hypothetical protein Moror_10670 [Moniliophthora roreri MCA 2997]|uniref:Uncharacterized protein n=1 Tax=Moniliophthora roreri (strain MCA 2997) TaxID=1381753 RepID=V2XFW4_MONRO|nr:hypothetical protein Moror_10670 [Moniliophthora roreri MCA 2997]